MNTTNRRRRRSGWGVIGTLVIALTAWAAEPPRVADEHIVLHTVGGDIVLALFPDVVPRHVAHVLELTRAGAYDTTNFFRIDPQGYYLQLSHTDDRLIPYTPAQQALARETVPAEFGRLPHTRGRLSMARDRGRPDSANSSFSIIRTDAPHLDPPNETYTIFGQVERGMDVVDHLALQRTPDGDAAPVRLTVLKAVVVTRAELATMSLRGPLAVAGAGQKIANPAEATAANAPGIYRAAVGGFIASAICAALAFWFARRLPGSRFAVSFALLGLLVAGFMLLVLLVPMTWNYSWLGAVVIAALLGVIKLMTYFDAEK